MPCGVTTATVKTVHQQSWKDDNQELKLFLAKLPTICFYTLAWSIENAEVHKIQRVGMPYTTDSGDTKFYSAFSA